MLSRLYSPSFLASFTPFPVEVRVERLGLCYSLNCGCLRFLLDDNKIAFRFRLLEIFGHILWVVVMKE